jgi:hypothetical protein
MFTDLCWYIYVVCSCDHADIFHFHIILNFIYILYLHNYYYIIITYLKFFTLSCNTIWQGTVYELILHIASYLSERIHMNH